MLTLLEYSFPLYWAWARCITWMERMLQTGQMCHAHLGEMHVHVVGTVIHSSSGGLGFLCVFRRLPSHARTQRPLGRGSGLFYFLQREHGLPLDSPGAPSQGTAGHSTLLGSLQKPSSKPEDWTRSEVDLGVWLSPRFCWKWEAQVSWSVFSRVSLFCSTDIPRQPLGRGALKT